jgi:hypothetical protein
MNLTLYPALKEEQACLNLISITRLVTIGTPMHNHKHLSLEIAVQELSTLAISNLLSLFLQQ